MQNQSSPKAVKQTHGSGGKLHRNMRGHRREVFAAASPNNGMIDAGTSHPQHKIAGGHVHIFDNLILAPPDHAAHTGHATHTGTEF